MQYSAKTPEQYFLQIPAERKDPMERLHKIILQNLPDGFEACMGYGMIGYAVPHSVYPSGYHCNPKEPLPFAGIASQKNFIAFYHMGMYAMPKLLSWFQNEFPKHSKGKLDMGKSCVRFKKTDHIPFSLIGALMKKVSVDEWIRVYEEQLKK